MRDSSKLINFRDLAEGIDDNFRLKKGILYRSGALTNITAEDGKYLTKNLRLKTYCDFRSDEEIERFGGPDLLIAQGVRWIRLPIVEGNHEFEKILIPTSVDYARSYMNILRVARDVVLDLLNLLASEEECFPLVFGCTAGKDRTGVVAAIILYLLGVDEANIARNYAKSSEYLLQRIDYFEPFWLKKGITQEQYSIRLMPKEETINLFLSYVRQEYADLQQYVEQLGVNQQLLQKLNDQFKL